MTATIDPDGAATTAQLGYGLDQSLRQTPGTLYNLGTAAQSVGSDSTAHTVTFQLTGLVPNARYHFALLASNGVVPTLLDKLFNQYGVAMIGFDVVFAEPDVSSGVRSLEALADPKDGALKDNDAFKTELERLKPSLDYDARFAKAMIQANPNLKGIFGSNEGSAEGAAIGVKESGKKLVLIGYDSGKEQKEDINSGLMYGAITQNPIGIGKCVVDSAVKALKGETLPKKVDTGFYWYDKSNMNDPKIAAVLYD